MEIFRAKERFKTKTSIEDCVREGMDSPCHRWNGSLSNDGYGSFSVGGKSTNAHRWAYELFVGPIPVGLQIDHLCRNRACVNPAHLEPVTSGENTRRGRNHWREKTHCLRGHPLSGPNLYATPAGYRQCKACRAQSQAKVRRRS